MAYQYYDAHFKEGHKVKTVKDVEAEKFIAAFAQHLKRQGRFEIPKWADVVKTSKAKELPPLNPDCLYVRTASMVRKATTCEGQSYAPTSATTTQFDGACSKGGGRPTGATINRLRVCHIERAWRGYSKFAETALSPAGELGEEQQQQQSTCPAVPRPMCKPSGP